MFLSDLDLQKIIVYPKIFIRNLHCNRKNIGFKDNKTNHRNKPNRIVMLILWLFLSYFILVVSAVSSITTRNMCANI